MWPKTRTIGGGGGGGGGDIGGGGGKGRRTSWHSLPPAAAPSRTTLKPAAPSPPGLRALPSRQCDAQSVIESESERFSPVKSTTSPLLPF
ncbi:Hypothetical protein NTJ_00959 [Nesidiocoris tenuis]|uniref:Uncharacterized protein n=1 Tax=Nesidiocoris tenuis TaxID=355587 RepID=A0ABN7A7B0_9HEMI|nr:Hypothetical protein NTJ_00959 [Nesidiocoris tenuis]